MIDFLFENNIDYYITKHRRLNYSKIAYFNKNRILTKALTFKDNFVYLVDDFCDYLKKDIVFEIIVLKKIFIIKI